MDFVILRDDEITLPFTALMPAPTSGGKGPSSLDWKNVVRIVWAVNENRNPRGTEGIIWLDEVSFY